MIVRSSVILLLPLFIVDRYLSFCTFSFGLCVVCPSSIYGFWLSLWYLQALLEWINVILFSVLLVFSWKIFVKLWCLSTLWKYESYIIFYCVLFLLCFSSSCVPNVARFSGLSIWFPLWYSLTFIWKQLAEVCYHIIKNQRIKWKYDYNGDINFPNKPLETTLNISYLLKLQKFWSNCIYVNVAKIVFDAINFYSD